MKIIAMIVVILFAICNATFVYEEIMANDANDANDDIDEDCGSGGGAPVDGGWSGWSTNDGCSKTCGGGTRYQYRKCDDPKPRNGGNDCQGSNSKVEQCSTQPCLDASSCNFYYTFYTDTNNPNSLSNHKLDCPPNKVFKEIRLRRDSTKRRMLYQYQCCTSQLPCTSTKTMNRATSNGGKKGKTYYLHHQTIDCQNKALSSLKLDHIKDSWSYRYGCCSPQYSKATVSCYDNNTEYKDDCDDNAGCLDEQTVTCNEDHFFTKMKLVRKGDKIRYDFTCCTISVPSQSD